jgi:hypothetical protein
VELAWPSLTLGPPAVQGPCLAAPPSRDAPDTYALAIAPGPGCTIRALASPR